SAEQVLRTILDARGAEKSAREIIRAAQREAAGRQQSGRDRVLVSAGRTLSGRRDTYASLTRGTGWGISR
ncbi:hypothetical protein, partial [Klebsiella pneumoniae]|uniref:hypothetical protein n=1 Tax=Klebsiella pneumoniae TaxID=573 RepID=UPI0025A122F9